MPDESTICRFRQRLIQCGLHEELLALFTTQLEARGYIVKRTTLVDATLIQSIRNRPDAQAARTGRAPDADARCTRAARANAARATTATKPTSAATANINWSARRSSARPTPTMRTCWNAWCRRTLAASTPTKPATPKPATRGCASRASTVRLPRKVRTTSSSPKRTGRRTGARAGCAAASNGSSRTGNNGSTAGACATWDWRTTSWS